MFLLTCVSVCLTEVGRLVQAGTSWAGRLSEYVCKSGR